MDACNEQKLDSSNPKQRFAPMIKKIIDILDSNDVIAYSDKEKLNVDMEETVHKLGISLKEGRLERTVSWACSQQQQRSRRT